MYVFLKSKVVKHELLESGEYLYIYVIEYAQQWKRMKQWYL